MKLKAAVIGLGRMGAQPSQRLEGKIAAGWLPISHVEAVLAINELELCALCDNDKERLAQLGKHYKVKSLFDDYKLLIDTIQPDFLCIATRTEGRTDIIKYASTHGVRIIYLEKPISRSIIDCRDTLDIVAKNNVLLGYGVNRRYHEVYRKAKEMVAAGAIGILKEVVIEHGTANLLWSHPHSVDLMMYFADTAEVDKLQATCAWNRGYTLHDPLFIDNDPTVENAVVYFKNGVKGIISGVVGSNTRLAGTTGIITIYSDGAYLEIHQMDSNGYLNAPENIKIQVKKSATVNAFEGLLKTLKQNTPPIITNTEILMGVAMLNGFVYSSMQDGKRIVVEDIPEKMIVTGKSGNFYA